MMWLLDRLVSIPFIGPVLKAVFGFVLQWQKQKLDAQGSHEAQVASLAAKQLELDQKEAEVQGQIVLAEQGNWFTRSVRPLYGWAAGILIWKILVWDLAFGQWTHGSTDKLSPQAFWLLTTIVIAYMGGRSAEKIADKIAGIWR